MAEKKAFTPTPKPTLESVLEWAGVQHSTERTRQMVHCPLTQYHPDGDKTPSLSIQLEEQLWKCHSCGRGGDSFTLIMEKAGVNFVGACKLAATESFAAGNAGGGDEQLPGLAHGRGGSVARGSRARVRGPAFKPSWRRG